MAKVTVNDCFYEIKNGANIKQGIIDGGYPITRIETLSNGVFNRDKLGYAGINNIDKYSEYVLDDEDLLMSHINSIQYLGRTVMYKKEENEKIIHGMNLLRLRPRKDKIYPKYIKYLFAGYRFKESISKITKKSVNQASFTIADLKKIVINIPSINDQIVISGIIERIEKVITERNCEIKLLDELIKAQFVDMFGDPIENPMKWEKVSLDSVCDVRDGTHESPEYLDNGYPLVTSKNVTSGVIDINNCNFISQEDYDKINERSKVDMGDIIMPMIGTVGKPVIVDIEPKFAIKNVALIKFVEESRVNNIYIKSLLESDYFNMAVISKIRGGTQKFIALKDIRKLDILVPPLSEQYKLVAFIQQINKSKLLFKSYFMKYKYCLSS